MLAHHVSREVDRDLLGAADRINATLSVLVRERIAEHDRVRGPLPASLLVHPLP